MKTKRVWWVTWPGALAMGGLSTALVLLTAVPLLGTAGMPAVDVSGTDLSADGGTGLGWRIAYVVVGLACLAVPVGVVVMARRGWLGWVLVLLAASLLVFGAGLWTLGII